MVKENTNYSYAAMEEIARNSFLDRVRNGDRIPASTMAITNVSGFLEMDSWVAANGAIGMGPIPVLNGAIFTFDGATQRVTSSNKLEILVTIKLGNDGRKNVDHLETTGEAAKPEHARHFSDYAAKAADANDIPWWLFGS